MMNKRWRVAVLGLASATAMLSAMLASASPASASTDGNQSATAGTPPQLDSAQCHEIDASVACFEPSGDKIWVLDHKADGKAAAGYWENYLRDSAGDWIIYRNGQCTNHLTAGNWGYCNYDFYEDTSSNADGGKGSGIRVYPCTETGPITSYTWVRNNG